MSEGSSEGASSSSLTETMTAKITRLTNKAMYPDWDVGLAAMLIVRKLHKELGKDPADVNEEKSPLIHSLTGQTISSEAAAVLCDEATKQVGGDSAGLTCPLCGQEIWAGMYPLHAKGPRETKISWPQRGKLVLQTKSTQPAHVSKKN